MKVMAHKGGHGHVTGYRITIGSAAARRCGFVLEDGERVELEAIENPDDKSITIRVVEKDEKKAP